MATGTKMSTGSESEISFGEDNSPNASLHQKELGNKAIPLLTSETDTLQPKHHVETDHDYDGIRSRPHQCQHPSSSPNPSNFEDVSEVEPTAAERESEAEVHQSTTTMLSVPQEVIVREPVDRAEVILSPMTEETPNSNDAQDQVHPECCSILEDRPPGKDRVTLKAVEANKDNNASRSTSDIILQSLLESEIIQSDIIQDVGDATNQGRVNYSKGSMSHPAASSVTVPCSVTSESTSTLSSPRSTSTFLSKTTFGGLLTRLLMMPTPSLLSRGPKSSSMDNRNTANESQPTNVIPDAVVGTSVEKVQPKSTSQNNELRTGSFMASIENNKDDMCQPDQCSKKNEDTSCPNVVKRETKTSSLPLSNISDTTPSKPEGREDQFLGRHSLSATDPSQSKNTSTQVSKQVHVPLGTTCGRELTRQNIKACGPPVFVAFTVPSKQGRIAKHNKTVESTTIVLNSSNQLEVGDVALTGDVNADAFNVWKSQVRKSYAEKYGDDCEYYMNNQWVRMSVAQKSPFVHQVRNRPGSSTPSKKSAARGSEINEAEGVIVTTNEKKCKEEKGKKRRSKTIPTTKTTGDNRPDHVSPEKGVDVLRDLYQSSGADKFPTDLPAMSENATFRKMIRNSKDVFTNPVIHIDFQFVWCVLSSSRNDMDNWMAMKTNWRESPEWLINFLVESDIRKKKRKAAIDAGVMRRVARTMAGCLDDDDAIENAEKKKSTPIKVGTGKVIQSEGNHRHDAQVQPQQCVAEALKLESHDRIKDRQTSQVSRGVVGSKVNQTFAISPLHDRNSQPGSPNRDMHRILTSSPRPSQVSFRPSDIDAKSNVCSCSPTGESFLKSQRILTPPSQKKTIAKLPKALSNSTSEKENIFDNDVMPAVSGCSWEPPSAHQERAMPNNSYPRFDESLDFSAGICLGDLDLIDDNELWNLQCALFPPWQRTIPFIDTDSVAMYFRDLNSQFINRDTRSRHPDNEYSPSSNVTAGSSKVNMSTAGRGIDGKKSESAVEVPDIFEGNNSQAVIPLTALKSPSPKFSVISEEQIPGHNDIVLTGKSIMPSDSLESADERTQTNILNLEENDTSDWVVSDVAEKTEPQLAAVSKDIGGPATDNVEPGVDSLITEETVERKGDEKTKTRHSVPFNIETEEDAAVSKLIELLSEPNPQTCGDRADVRSDARECDSALQQIIPTVTGSSVSLPRTADSHENKGDLQSCTSPSFVSSPSSVEGSTHIKTLKLSPPLTKEQNSELDRPTKKRPTITEDGAQSHDDFLTSEANEAKLHMEIEPLSKRINASSSLSMDEGSPDDAGNDDEVKMMNKPLTRDDGNKRAISSKSAPELSIQHEASVISSSSSFLQSKSSSSGEYVTADEGENKLSLPQPLKREEDKDISPKVPVKIQEIQPNSPPFLPANGSSENKNMKEIKTQGLPEKDKDLTSTDIFDVASSSSGRGKRGRKKRRRRTEPPGGTKQALKSSSESSLLSSSTSSPPSSIILAGPGRKRKRGRKVKRKNTKRLVPKDDIRDKAMTGEICKTEELTAIRGDENEYVSAEKEPVWMNTRTKRNLRSSANHEENGGEANDARDNSKDQKGTSTPKENCASASRSSERIRSSQSMMCCIQHEDVRGRRQEGI